LGNPPEGKEKSIQNRGTQGACHNGAAEGKEIGSRGLKQWEAKPPTKKKVFSLHQCDPGKNMGKLDDSSGENFVGPDEPERG